MAALALLDSELAARPASLRAVAVVRSLRCDYTIAMFDVLLSLRSSRCVVWGFNFFLLTTLRHRPDSRAYNRVGPPSRGVAAPVASLALSIVQTRAPPMNASRAELDATQRLVEPLMAHTFACQ